VSCIAFGSLVVSSLHKRLGALQKTANIDPGFFNLFS
jgi:hypothetical protein